MSRHQALPPRHAAPRAPAPAPRRWLRSLGLLLAAGVLLSAPALGAERDAKETYEHLGCAFCHGADGRTPKWDTYPVIAGQMPRYSYLAMKSYQAGERQGAGANSHEEVNNLLSDKDMRKLADYIAAMP